MSRFIFKCLHTDALKIITLFPLLLHVIFLFCAGAAVIMEGCFPQARFLHLLNIPLKVFLQIKLVILHSQLLFCFTLHCTVVQVQFGLCV